MKYLIIPFLLFAVSCAFNKDDSSPALKNQLEQDARVQELFGPIVGTYEGTAKYSSSTHRIRLILKIVRESTGTVDSNGTPLFKDVAKGIYKKIDPVGSDQTLIIDRYDQRTNVLKLSKPNNPGNNGAGGNGSRLDNNPNNNNNNNAAPGDVDFIEATITGQHIVGTLNTVNGSTPPIDLTLTTRETGNGAAEDEDFERLKSEVAPIIGIYKGTLADATAEGGMQRIKISLSMNEIGHVIYLSALYQREDIPSGVVDLSLSATYRTDVTPRVITFIGRGGGTYFLDIAGPISKNPATNLYEINATINLRGAFKGRTILKQQPAEDAQPPAPPAPPTKPKK